MVNWKERVNRARNTAQRLAGSIKEKNRHAAAINRLRTVLRCQEKAAEKEYLALGRYYYNALRDSGSPVAEEHCKRLDEINALLDGALKELEKSVRDSEAASVSIIGGADGPTAVYIKDKKKREDDGTIFHFGGDSIEITVKRDVVYHPEDEDSEEIDLSDVESFDHDPMPEKPVPSAAAEVKAEPELAGADLDENDGLPFEG